MSFSCCSRLTSPARVQPAADGNSPQRNAPRPPKPNTKPQAQPVPGTVSGILPAAQPAPSPVANPLAGPTGTGPVPSRSLPTLIAVKSPAIIRDIQKENASWKNLEPEQTLKIPAQHFLPGGVFAELNTRDSNLILGMDYLGNAVVNPFLLLGLSSDILRISPEDRKMIVTNSEMATGVAELDNIVNDFKNSLLNQTSQFTLKDLSPERGFTRGNPLAFNIVTQMPENGRLFFRPELDKSTTAPKKTGKNHISIVATVDRASPPMAQASAIPLSESIQAPIVPITATNLPDGIVNIQNADASWKNRDPELTLKISIQHFLPGGVFAEFNTPDSNLILGMDYPSTAVVNPFLLFGIKSDAVCDVETVKARFNQLQALVNPDNSPTLSDVVERARDCLLEQPSPIRVTTHTPAGSFTRGNPFSFNILTQMPEKARLFFGPDLDERTTPPTATGKYQICIAATV